MNDAQSLFTDAEQHFRRGDMEAARDNLVRLRQQIGDNPAILHLLALVERRRGAIDSAKACFRRALDLSPDEPQILSNAANLHVQTEEFEEALSLYDTALQRAPGSLDIRLNRAILLGKMRRFHEAGLAFHDIEATWPAVKKLHLARGAMESAAGEWKAAGEAFDRALRIDANDARAAFGRARVALERGEEDAPARYRALASRAPQDLNVRLGYAEALEAAGDPAGLAVLQEAVGRNPQWIEGHERLTRMRSEAADPEPARSYLAALPANMKNRALWASYIESLAGLRLYGQALQAVDAAQVALGSAAELALTEAVCAVQHGDVERAEACFRRLSDRQDDGIDRGRARLALRKNEPGEAARLLERLVERGRANISDWAYLSLAWRAVGDDQYHWLCLQPNLIGVRDLEFSAGELDRLAIALRSLHRTKAHPAGQSLREGTQTRGRLFARGEPEIGALKRKIVAAVEDFRCALPAYDPKHPLLRMRDRAFRLEGSWSVRLRDKGFHVQHIHPRGLLSSAFYVSLPGSLAGSAAKEGWLELGGAPEELNMQVVPVQMIEPHPGRLALFPSYMFHGTRPFQAGERLIVAFDGTPA